MKLFFLEFVQPTDLSWTNQVEYFCEKSKKVAITQWMKTFFSTNCHFELKFGSILPTKLRYFSRNNKLSVICYGWCTTFFAVKWIKIVFPSPIFEFQPGRLKFFNFGFWTFNVSLQRVHSVEKLSKWALFQKFDINTKILHTIFDVSYNGYIENCAH